MFLNSLLYNIRMREAYALILDLYTRFKTLEDLLRTMVKQEEFLEDHVLAKHGFVIHRYTLKVSQVHIENLEKLGEEFRKVKAIEQDIRYKIKKARKLLKIIQQDYEVYLDEKLPLRIIFTQYMNNAFNLSERARGNTILLSELLKDGLKIHKHALSGRVKRCFDGLEKTTNQIIIFIDILRQINMKLDQFEKDSYYPSPRIYGRAMSKAEVKKTLSGGALVGSAGRQKGDLIGVFNCPPAVMARVSSMSDDERRNFFGQIGVVGGIRIIFFSTALVPKAGPIPQSNSLQEFKFPRGVYIENIEAA